jgi:hypothetical protein
MPTATARDVDAQQREAAARVKIAEAIREADLTPIQAVHLLATTLTDYTRRLEAREARELDAKETIAP